MKGHFLRKNGGPFYLLFWRLESELWTLLEPWHFVVGILEIHHQFYSKRLQPTPSKSSINQSETYVKKPANTSNKFQKYMKNQQNNLNNPITHTKNMCHFSSCVTSTRPNNRMNLQNRGPGIWQMHPNARQAICRCPGTTAGGIAIDTEMHLGKQLTKTSWKSKGTP